MAAIRDLDTRYADSLCVFTDGSGINGMIGSSAVLVPPNNGYPEIKRARLGPDTEHIVYEGELYGVHLGLQLLHDAIPSLDPIPKSATILIDNQAAIPRSCRPAPKSAQYLAQSVCESALELRRLYPDLVLQIAWVPGHAGVEGNDLADEHAKDAASDPNMPLATMPGHRSRLLPKNRSALKAVYNSELELTWTNRWILSERGMRFAHFDPDPPSLKHVQKLDALSRPQASLYTQLRSGHIGLNFFLHRIGASDSPNCTTCHVPETVNHFLMQCSRFVAHRSRLRLAIAPAPLDTRTLLSSENIKAVSSFCIETRRFVHYTAR